jgi:DNA-binding transcriptional LysR family regulator
MVMELRQLEYFVAVADEANFTRAAARLHVAQPGVSAQVRRLERELGHELLDRSGRTVTLTDVGAAVLPHARAALAAADSVRLMVDEMAGLVRGRVAVGTIRVPNVDLVKLLAGIRHDHPGVEITLVEDDADRLVDRLRHGRLDAALVGLGPTEPDDLELLVVTDVPLVAAVAEEDELARRKTVPLEALRERPLIMLGRGTAVRAIVDEACAAAGFTPTVAFEASTPATISELAARGLGVAILPAAPEDVRDDLHLVTIVRPRLRGRVAFAWRRDGPTSPAARLLTERARQAFGG